MYYHPTVHCGIWHKNGKNTKILFLNALNESHRKAVYELKKHQLQHCGGEDIEFISSGELLSLCLYFHKYQGNPKCFFVFEVQEILIYCMEIPLIEANSWYFFSEQSVCWCLWRWCKAVSFGLSWFCVPAPGADGPQISGVTFILVLL